MIFTLNNGISLPSPGYGTSNLGEGEEVRNKIISAAECGFRHFDTAPIYYNEEFVGEGLSFVFENICRRNEVVIAGKISNDDLQGLSDGYNKTKQVFQRTLEKLQVDYLDLYLIHWPVPRYAENCWKELNITTWQAIEEFYTSGKVKAIGVSNFKERHIQNIVENAHIKPMVNQIEIQPLYQQRDLIRYCSNNQICVEAWGPLKQGEVFKIPEMQVLSKKYNKSISQIAIKFCEQLNALPLVRCSTKERMLENLDVSEWEISSEDMEILYALDRPDGRYQNYAYARRDSC